MHNYYVFQEVGCILSNTRVCERRVFKIVIFADSCFFVVAGSLSLCEIIQLHF